MLYKKFCFLSLIKKERNIAMKKYQKFSKSDYITWYNQNLSYRTKVAKDPNRLHYHLMPETGWLNDPNGLCQFHGTYHIYYQYTPFEPTGELKSWGHYTTKDFIYYENHPPVLFPDSDIDAHGVYSGSAFIKDDTLHFFYTGNIKYFDRDDYDYILSGRGSNTIHVTSKDGFTFGEKELLMTTEDYPDTISCHIRDPKIYQHNDEYYMILGARDIDSHGLILIYHSNDLKHWQYHQQLTTSTPFGYMWECPDVFIIDSQLALICCPQGVETFGIEYENVHQCTFMQLQFDEKTNLFSMVPNTNIQLVDRGFDFYAPQTFEDETGRRILIGWMGIPEADYTNPTTKQGWQHALTLPRTLHFEHGHLYQRPLVELQALRHKKRHYDLSLLSSAKETALVYEALITFTTCESMELTLREGVTLSSQPITTLSEENPIKKQALISYDPSKPYILTLDLGTHGSGRTTRSVALSSLQNLQIFSDTSSLEIFVNDGEEVFTTRVYGQQGNISISGSYTGSLTLYDMKSYHILTQTI